MRIDEILRDGKPVFSFEFFPPQSEKGIEDLMTAIAHLSSLQPDFVSVTYGAGGSARLRTLELVTRIRSEAGIEPMAHFTCVGASTEELREVLDRIANAGIENVLALRGDPPNGDATFLTMPGGLSHGSELAQLMSEHYDFCVGAACYPEKHLETETWDDEFAHTKRKIASGAKFLITQLFFDNSFYFSFVKRARENGIHVPIIPGIMPITNVAQIQRFTSRIGATIPHDLTQALEECRENPQAVIELGIAWATSQCTELLAAGAPGVHFYTLNRSPATRAILTTLRVAKPWAVSAGGAAMKA